MLLSEAAQTALMIETYIRLAIYVVLPLTLVFVIALGALKNNSNYIFKSFVIAIIGGVISLLFILASILDFSLKVTHILGLFTYIVCLGSSIGLTLTFSLTLFFKGKKRYQRLSFKNSKPTIDRNITKYLYLVFKSGNNVLLQKKNELNSGIIFKLDKNHIFEDEAIENIAKSFNCILNYDETRYVGSLTKVDKKKTIYRCYLIETNIDEQDLNLEKFELVDQYKLISYPMDDFNRKLLLRTLMKQEFNIVE